MWSFPGQGDSSSSSTSRETGKQVVTTSSSSSSTNDQSGKTSTGSSSSTSTTNYDDAANTAKNLSDSYSTSNSQTGLMCRRYVSDMTKPARVTLLVYRMTKDGGTEGISITVEVKPTEAKVTATNPEGKDYEIK
jgi:hypothetical protein